MDEITTLDARGLLCPLPVLKARKALKSLATGQALKILTDDPAALIDMPHFCAEANHRLTEQVEMDGYHVFVIHKGG